MLFKKTPISNENISSDLKPQAFKQKIIYEIKYKLYNQITDKGVLSALKNVNDHT